MNDLPPLDDSNLSEDDLAVLDAFDAFENWEHPAEMPASSGLTSEQSEEKNVHTEILSLFYAEIGEDITTMHRILHHLEQEEHLHSTHLSALRRPAHKIRGTAGSIEYHLMAEIAHRIEIIIERTGEGMIYPLVGFHAIREAVQALEDILTTLRATGIEDDERYQQFANMLYDLAFDAEETVPMPEVQSSQTRPLADIQFLSDEVAQPQDASIRTDQADQQVGVPMQAGTTTGLSITLARVDRVIAHTEGLVGMHTQLASAEAQVEQALQDLQLAQQRLRHLEGQFAQLYTTPRSPYELHSQPSSSLITRILGETPHNQLRPHRARLHPHRALSHKGNDEWDPLELDHYTERDSLSRAFNETIADIAVSSARLRTAFDRLRTLTSTYSAQAAEVRDDALALRTAPFSTILPVIRDEIEHEAARQGQQVAFSVEGVATEIDQEVLQECKQVLLHLVRICIADTLITNHDATLTTPYRIWLQARHAGSEVAIELGFSMQIQGGALDFVRTNIQRLHGTIHLQRNSTNGVSFHILLPRSQSAVRCLQVRVGAHHLLIPFVQVQRISYGGSEEPHHIYALGELLSLPPSSQKAAAVEPILFVQQHNTVRITGISVDEVVEEMELMVRPLTPYLQRPGITGAAIDGMGRILLVVDLAELLRQHTTLRRQNIHVREESAQFHAQQTQTQRQLLIADDSASMRQTLRQMLSQTDFVIREARDGMEALELLLELPPDIFVLDMEMPNLNGYELLDNMRLYPELARIKIIMLTSRTIEKYRQHALKLGVHVYLTKPCPQQLLLETIARLLP